MEDLNLDEKEEQLVPVSRINELSKKNRITEAELSEKTKLVSELEADKATAEKKISFYKDFSKLSVKYSGASDYIDDIESKVMAGYDPEDAAISVLAKAGKLTTPAPEKEIVSGGSADTSIRNETDKTSQEMTQEERRATLSELSDKGELRVGGNSW